MGDAILQSLVKRLESALEAIKKDLSGVRTGRAKTTLVADVRVEAYGSLMTVKEVASLTSPDPSLIVVAPWDKSLVAAIASGIQKADLNLQPVVDGETIKIAIPPLTAERRAEMVKLVHTKMEGGRVLLRNIRTEIKEELEGLEGESGVSEDDIKTWLGEMQKQVDGYTAKIEELGKGKEQELLTL